MWHPFMFRPLNQYSVRPPFATTAARNILSYVRLFIWRLTYFTYSSLKCSLVSVTLDGECVLTEMLRSCYRFSDGMDFDQTSSIVTLAQGLPARSSVHSDQHVCTCRRSIPKAWSCHHQGLCAALMFCRKAFCMKAKKKINIGHMPRVTSSTCLPSLIHSLCDSVWVL